MQVLEARVDHTRVVQIHAQGRSSTAGEGLPPSSAEEPIWQAVNEAVNELLVEEEDYSGLRDSINTYDSLRPDRLGLCSLEEHELTRVPPHLLPKSTKTTCAGARRLPLHKQ